MSSDVVAALIGVISGAFAGYWGAVLKLRSTQLEISARHRAMLSERQLNALESIWPIFDAASRTGGMDRMLDGQKRAQVFKVTEGRQFVRKLEETFNSKSGLYLSEKCRRAIFKFRDHVRDNLVGTHPDGTIYSISEKNVDEFHLLRRFARLTIRADIGTTNLKVLQQELRKYEKRNKDLLSVNAPQDEISS